jgi:hypothetical protein
MGHPSTFTLATSHASVSLASLTKVQPVSLLRGFQQSWNSQPRQLQFISGFPNQPNPSLGIDSSPSFFQQLGTPADGISGGFGPFASKVNPVSVTKTLFSDRSNPANGITPGPKKGVQDISGLPVSRTFPGLQVSFTIPAYTPLPNFPGLPSNFTKIPPIPPLPTRKFRDYPEGNFPGLP